MNSRLLGFALFVILLAGCSLLAPPPSFNGAVYGQPAPPPNFRFESTTGADFTLNDQKGKVTLLFFGYTSCPDICPITLGSIKTALGQMSPEDSEHVQLLFISVDPRRDSLERVAGYLARYNAGYIGVAPTQDELDTLLAGYGVFAEPDGSSEESNSYLVTHTGLTLAIDKGGELRIGILSDASPEDIAHDLTILARE